MDKIEKRNYLFYAAGKDERRDLFVTVELSDEIYGKDEENVIDAAMKNFYKEYDDEMHKLRKARYGKGKNQETKV